MTESKGQGVSGELASNTSDYVAMAVKAALGLVPFAGSLLAEIGGTIIPNQRADRLAKFAKILNERLGQLEQDFVRSQITNENFTDLIEEGLRQAARSVSEERREYIASLIANSLKSEDIQYQESKHLLRILGNLNDVEIIWLRYYLDPTLGGDEEFRQKHAEILEPVSAHRGSPQSVVDKETLQQSYLEHLADLSLLKRRYEIDSSSAFGAKLKTRGFDLSGLGWLMLREVGLAPREEN